MSSYCFENWMLKCYAKTKNYSENIYQVELRLKYAMESISTSRNMDSWVLVVS